LASARNPARPLSPHLSIWKWGPHMLVSILHRATGSGMATVGTLLLVWWLAAIASGEEAYAGFRDVFTTDRGALNILGWVIAVGLTLSLFQHMMTGIRHFFLDVGAGYELKTNKTFAMLTMVAAVTLTTIYWLYMGMK
jgi:succinate dehydrogenase / fumarate reductase cytochrome b subunit